MDARRSFRISFLSPHVSVIRILILLAIAPMIVSAIFVLIAFVNGLISQERALTALLPSIMFVAFSFLIILGVFRISSPRILSAVQFVAFVLLICFISSWSKDTPVAITGAGMIALGLIFLWAVNQLPVLLYVLFLLILLCGTFAYMIPEILKLEEKKFMPFYEIYFYLWSNFRVSFALLSVGMLLIACAYFPRRLELKRYFGIYPIRKVPVPPERKFGGFTLIEILICIAIIGIITGGILSGWRYCLHQQRELYHRVQIQEILSSELNEILTGKEIPPVGTEVRDLPISLSAFGEQPDLSGGYTVSETDEEGIVRIQVALTQYMENSVSRRFELVGYRHIARGES